MTDREAAAKRHGLPDGFGERLQGSSDYELDADAQKLAELIGAQREPEHVQLAKRAIEAANENPHAAFIDALTRNDKKHAGLVELLHPTTTADPEKS